MKHFGDLSPTSLHSAVFHILLKNKTRGVNFRKLWLATPVNI